MKDRRLRQLGRREIDDRIRKTIMRDDVTGLYRTDHLNFIINIEVERSRNYGYEFSLVFLDIDHFKTVNDTHGHVLGTKIIGDVGQFIEAACSRIDFAFRYGGDEFAIVQPQRGKDSGVAWAEKLICRVRDLTWQGLGGQSVRVTMSAGVASFPKDGNSAEELIKQADSAMYSVKNKTRDGVGQATDSKSGKSGRGPGPAP